MCLRKTLHWHFFYKGKKSKFHLKNDEGIFASDENTFWV